jgi:hypothetical protein
MEQRKLAKHKQKSDAKSVDMFIEMHTNGFQKSKKSKRRADGAKNRTEVHTVQNATILFNTYQDSKSHKSSSFDIDRRATNFESSAGGKKCIYNAG